MILTPITVQTTLIIW